MKQMIVVSVLLISLAGCQPSTERVGEQVKSMMQTKLDEDPTLKKYHLMVSSVHLVRTEGNRYEGVATIAANGEEHNIGMKVLTDGKQLIYEANKEDFGFFGQLALADALAQGPDSSSDSPPPSGSDAEQAGPAERASPQSPSPSPRGTVLSEPFDAQGSVADKADPAVSSEPLEASPTSRFQPSFDCKKAHSLAELLICDDAELAALDRENEVIYARARAVAPNEMEFVRRNREAWLGRERDCSDKPCLVQWYATRKRELSALMDAAPGAPAK